MTRLRHRPTHFFHRGDRFAFHRLQDGATLGRLDPYSAEPQSWPLHSGRVIDVTAEEVREITKQVHGLDLPATRPEGGSCNCGPRLDAIEARLVALEAEAETPDIPEPPPSSIPSSQVEALEEDATPPPADPGEVSILSSLEELKARIDKARSGGSELSSVEDAEPLTPDDLINMVSDIPPGSAELIEGAVKSIRGEARKKFTELLNVELAELEQERTIGSARADLKRERDIEYLLGLFARLGEY